MPSSYDQYSLCREEKIKCLCVCSAMVFTMTYIFYKSWLLSFFSIGLSYYSLRIYADHLVRRRKRMLTLQFKDAIYSISAAIAAGRQLPQAIQESAVTMKMLYGEEGLITKELVHISKRIFYMNEPENQVLLDFASRTNIPDIRNFVDIYITCKTAGADVEQVLAKTSRMIIDKITIDKEIKAITSQKKLEANILVIMPVIVIGFMQIVSAEYIDVMYSTSTGRLVMTGSLLAIAWAYKTCQKITNISL